MDTCAYCNAKPIYRAHESGIHLCPVHAWLAVTGPRKEIPRPPLTIRSATPDDRSRIAEIAERFGGKSEIECFGPAVQIEALPAYVACEEDLIVGAVSYTPQQDTVSLVMLDVLPGWQGRGAARALIGAVIQEAQAAGAKRILIATSNDDLPSLGLYQRLGFAITGVLAGKLAECRGSVNLGFDGIPQRDVIQLELRL